MKDELSEAKAKLDQLNEALTKFRTDNAGKLPEQKTMNMAQMTSLQQRLATINDALNRSAQDRVLFEERLATLQNQMALSDSLDKEVEVSAPARSARISACSNSTSGSDTEQQFDPIAAANTGDISPIFATPSRPLNICEAAGRFAKAAG